MNDLTIQQKFEENIKNRLREDIGNLLPDEVLSEMLKRATHDLFFAKSGSNNSWFEKEVSKIITPIIQSKIHDIFANDNEEFKLAFSEAMKEGFPKLMATIFFDTLRHNTTNMLNMQGAYYNLNNQIQQITSRY